MARELIGRDRPLAVVTEAVRGLASGLGSFVTVAGEAGIGKTALLGAVAEEATAAGARVLHGTCWDGGGAPGYWPWIQAVRGLERSLATADWDELCRRGGDGLKRLLGELPDPPPGVDDTSFQLFDAVTAVLLEAARLQPVVVLLDDLHWADPASIRLLEFVVRHTALDPVLLVAAYRDDEVALADHPLHALMAGLSAKATLVPLRGLDVDAVGRLMDAARSGAPSDVVAEVHRQTAGNPFFVEQATVLWNTTRSVAGLATGVEDAVERRLARLPQSCVNMLATASLLDGVVDLAVLAAAAEIPASDVERELAPAVTARVITQDDSGTFRFVHDLVRERLSASLDEAGARARHASIVRAVDADTTLAARVFPAQLAHHAYLAVPEIEPELAVALLLDAGRDASRRLAFDEACRHVERAHDVAKRTGQLEAGDIALDLGAQQHRAGDLVAARRTFAEAAVAARASGDGEALARAALGLHLLGYGIDEGMTVDATELVDEALAVLAADPRHGHGSALLARLTAAAGQARAHQIGADRDEGEQLGAAAVEMARLSGDADVLGFCLLAHHDAIWRLGTTAARLALTEEMTGVARRTANRELELQASLLRVVALLEAGERGAFAELDAFAALAERTRLPRFRYLSVSRRGTMLTLQGRFAEARRLVDDALELGHRMGEVDSRSVWHDQTWQLDRLQGLRDEIEALLEQDRAEGYPLVPVLEAMEALERGDVGPALDRLAEIDRIGASWPQWAESMWLRFQAQLAAASGDAARRAQARAGIAPYRDQWVVLGGAVVVDGPLSYWAAVVDAADGRWDDALAGFTDAERQAGDLGAEPWVLLSRSGRAGALLGRNGGGDADLATALLDAVVEQADGLGMAAVAATARARRGDAPGERQAAPQPDVFRFDGSVWTLTFAGRTALIPDAKGLHDLHVLLSCPGTDVPAGALLDPSAGPVAVATARMGSDAVLDDEAKAQYRARLSELDRQIDRAVARHDDAGAAALDAERDALMTELRRAAGLGGRDRRLGDDGERVRKTVTARIRDTLRRLDGRHPALAAHLRAAVTTGSTCSYRPEVAVDWHL